nr:hypothetical protein HK105_004087 [Polyrhizophydium stewartii]
MVRLALVAAAAALAVCGQPPPAADTPAGAPELPTGVSLPVTDANFTVLYKDTHQPALCPVSERLLKTWPAIVEKAAASNRTLRFASIDAWANTATLAVLEVRSLPAIKLTFSIQDGRVYTFKEGFSVPAVLQFVRNGTQTARWYNRLPTSYFTISKLQFDVFVTIQRVQQIAYDAFMDLLLK